MSAGSRSRCERWRAQIVRMVEGGLGAQRIHEDLRAGHGFSGSYSSVKRFVAKLDAALPRRVMRMECEPGQEMQVDFMAGPMLPDPQRPGKRRRCWIFRAVLSCSRKGYSEAVWRQDSESFLRALENAVRAFGGVPALLNLDNLKAAVTKADWCDPELSPKFAAFCRHYGMTPMPCRPYSPQHKGKVERGMRYVRGSALAGREFAGLRDLNTHLVEWEARVADTRIHGTTRRQVGEHFEVVERPALGPLPTELFGFFEEGRRKVHRDGYVEVRGAFYQAPTEYLRRTVWVQWDARQVRLLNERMEQIACHGRLEPGRFSEVRGVRALDHGGSLEACMGHWQRQAQAIGPVAGRWAASLIQARGAQAIRSIQGLCKLRTKHASEPIEAACAAAMAARDTPRLADIRTLLKDDSTPACQQVMAFLQSDPLIRELSHYGAFVQTQSQSPHPNDHAPPHHPQDPGPPPPAGHPHSHP